MGNRDAQKQTNLTAESITPVQRHAGASRAVRKTMPKPGAQIMEAQRLQMLNEISRALSSRLDLRNVYDTIYEQISRVMDTSMFFLALAQPDKSACLAYVREFGRLSENVIPPAGPSVTTHVVQLGQALLFHTDEHYERYARSHGLPVIVLGDETRGSSQSMMYAPLNTGSDTLGTLSVQSTRQFAYSTDDLNTLAVIASQAAIAIQNARLYEASLESARRRQSLLRVAETVNSSLELGKVLKAILDGINDVMPYHLAAIMLPNYRTGVLDTMGAVGGMSEQAWREMKVMFGHGITGTCFAEGVPIVVDDVTTFPEYIVGSDSVRSEVAVPLKHADTVVGILNVERSEPAAFSVEDVELLSLFATQAATAIENARLFEEQRNRVLEMQALQALVQDMTRLHERTAMAALIEEGIRKLIDVDECSVHIVDHDLGLVIPILSNEDRGVEQRVPRGPRKLGEGIPGWIAKAGHSDVFSSTKTDERCTAELRNQDWDFTVIAAPLLHQGMVTGVITAGRDVTNAFHDNDLRLLEIVASHAAIGLDRCRLYEELHRQATTDSLTGLFNRRYLADRLHEEMSRANRNHHPLAALMIDADDFKRINDRFGHDAGDAVLRELAQVIRAELRTEDIVARYGGEEFLVLLPEVAAEGAISVGQRLCRLIATKRLSSQTGLGHINVSIGVATLDPADAAEEMVTRADLAMYEAKRRGGNKVCACSGGSYYIPQPSASRQSDKAA